MDVQIVSDLHLDFKDNYNWALKNFKQEADILLVAGDTCEYYASHRDKYHDKFFNKWKTIVEVPGNHDFYGFHVDSMNRKHCFETCFKAHDECGQSCLRYVNNDIVDLDDVRIICTTLWSKIYPANYRTVYSRMNDYSEISGYSIKENNEINNLSIEFIEKALNESSNKKCIVLTHHLPLWNLINPQYANHALNDAYANDLTDIITRYNDIIKYWIHGHSHDSLQQKCGETICARNPVGYVKYGEANGYSPMVIKL